ALGTTVDISYAEYVHVMKVRREDLGRFYDESIPLFLEIIATLPPPYFFFMFRGAGKKLVIDKGVYDVPLLVFHEFPVIPGPYDDVMRLPVVNLEPLPLYSFVCREGERYHLLFINNSLFARLDGIDPLDPFVYHGVQPVHVKLDLYVLIDLCLHHVLFSSSAPERNT